jgi:hypothetical protein
MIDPASLGIQAALDQVNAMLAKEGGKRTLVERKGSTLLVRYEAPAPADCPTCAIDGDSAVMLLRWRRRGGIQSTSRPSSSFTRSAVIVALPVPRSHNPSNLYLPKAIESRGEEIA